MIINDDAALHAGKKGKIMEVENRIDGLIYHVRLHDSADVVPYAATDVDFEISEKLIKDATHKNELETQQLALNLLLLTDTAPAFHMGITGATAIFEPDDMNDDGPIVHSPTLNALQQATLPYSDLLNVQRPIHGRRDQISTTMLWIGTTQAKQDE